METRSSWREPTSLLELRWGRYRPRYVGAIVLILAGALVLQAGSAYADYLILIGFVSHIAGWAILPARGGPRAAVAVPSALLVGSLLLGSVAAVLLVGPLAFWLMVRQRPARSYLATLLPLVSGLALARLYPQYGDGAIVVAVSLVVIVASAWLARAVARPRALRP
ncbi:hypothetical protein ACVXZ4_15950 [Lacisediminihabitans sp. FW035]